MKKIIVSILCLMIISGGMPVNAINEAQNKKPAAVKKTNLPKINVGFVFDGPSGANSYFLEKFKKSVTDSLKNDYTVNYPTGAVFTADWTEKGARATCDKALQSNANIIVALGYLSSQYMSGLKNKKKFVVTIDQYGLRDFGPGFFSPVSQLSQQVELFKRLTNFKKVAILINEGYFKTRSDWNTFLGKKFEGKNIDFVMVPVNGSVDGAIAKIPADADAAYVLPQFTLTLPQLEELFTKLSDKKIFTFSALGESDVKMGCLLGTGALDLDRKIAESASFNIKEVLSGSKKNNFEKLYFYEDDIIWINTDTAEKIGYNAPIRLLTNARKISNKKLPQYNLEAVFNKLDIQNTDIRQKSYLVKAARSAVVSAYLKYLPTFSVTLGYQSYNHEWAESAALIYPEKTGVFRMGIDQVIYSPALITNILIKHRQKDFQYAEKLLTEQNMGINAALLYIDTLMLENSIKIQEEYVKESRENLAMARVREKLGYCGSEEAMRWASQLRINEQNLIDLNSEFKNIKIMINKILAEPQNQDFTLAELKANDPAFYTSDLYVLDYVRTPEALEKFTQYLVEEAFEVSPELEKLKAAIRMKNAERAMYVQKFILPDAKLTLQYQSLMNREFGEDQLHLQVPMLGAINTAMPRSDATNGYFGIFAQWKPIEGGTKFAEISRINNERKQLLAMREGAKLSLEEHIRTIINEALTCYFSIEKDYKAMYAAKENYETVKDAYLRGKTPIAQLTDAQEVYLNAKLKAVNAQYEFFKKLVWVQRCLCSVNWAKASPRSKAWVEKIKTDMEKMNDIAL